MANLRCPAAGTRGDQSQGYASSAGLHFILSSSTPDHLVRGLAFSSFGAPSTTRDWSGGTGATTATRPTPTTTVRTVSACSHRSSASGVHDGHDGIIGNSARAIGDSAHALVGGGGSGGGGSSAAHTALPQVSGRVAPARWDLSDEAVLELQQRVRAAQQQAQQHQQQVQHQQRAASAALQFATEHPDGDALHPFRAPAE